MPTPVTPSWDRPLRIKLPNKLYGQTWAMMKTDFSTVILSPAMVKSLMMITRLLLHIFCCGRGSLISTRLYYFYGWNIKE